MDSHPLCRYPEVVGQFENLMPIPQFAAHGALPPFIDGNPTSSKSRSPYQASMRELVDQFCTSEPRARLLLGLNEYRRHLLSGGFISGMQWIDGSFLENVEAKRGRPPSDIDVVTLFNRPIRYQAQPAAWQADYASHIHRSHFDTRQMKPKFSCDTYGVDMDAGSRSLIRGSTFYFDLFTGMKESDAKKGIVEIPLANDVLEFQAIKQQIGGKFNV